MQPGTQALSQTANMRALGYGVLVSVGMFWVLHLLIAGGGAFSGDSQQLPTIDFVRLKKDTELETRTRKKPPKPEPPKQPPPPKMKVEAPPPEMPQVPFKMPKMDISARISGGPFLGAVGGDLSGYSDLIPLVRIQPQYPRNAARDRIEGWVELELVVNPDGTVRSARPIKAQPRGVFETAAIQAMLKAKFKPKVVDGKPVEQKAIQRVDFNLDEAE